MVCRGHASSMLLAFAAAVSASDLADDAMHFLAIGDWGGSSDHNPVGNAEKDNANGMAAAASALGGIRFVLAEGDNFYGSGIHGDEHCQRFVDGFENAFPQPELQVPFYAIAGNHDHLGNVTAQVEYAQYSKRWMYPDYWYDFTENFTTTDGRTVTTQIVHIDTVTIAGMSSEEPDFGKFYPHHMQARLGEQLQWLEQTLSSSTADYLWIGGHFPVYSQCSHGPTKQMIKLVLPLMYKYSVSGFVAGHDHCLGHYTQDDMAFVVTGAGKSCCYGANNLNNSANAGDLKFRMDGGQKHGAEAGFASFSVTATETTIRYLDHAGKVLYTADVVAPRSGKVPTPMPPTPEPTPAPPPGPAPAGWECQWDHKSSLKGDKNLRHTGDDISTCTKACEQTDGCVAVLWHKNDNHCHIKVGNFTREDWISSISGEGSSDTCFATAVRFAV